MRRVGPAASRRRAQRGPGKREEHSIWVRPDKQCCGIRAQIPEAWYANEICAAISSKRGDRGGKQCLFIAHLFPQSPQWISGAFYTTIDFRSSPLITYLVPPSLDHAPDSSLQDCHLRGDIGWVAGRRGGEGGQEGQTHVFLLVGVGGRHPGTTLGNPVLA